MIPQMPTQRGGLKFDTPANSAKKVTALVKHFKNTFGGFPPVSLAFAIAKEPSIAEGAIEKMFPGRWYKPLMDAGLIAAGIAPAYQLGKALYDFGKDTPGLLEEWSPMYYAVKGAPKGQTQEEAMIEAGVSKEKRGKLLREYSKKPIKESGIRQWELLGLAFLSWEGAKALATELGLAAPDKLKFSQKIIDKMTPEQGRRVRELWSQMQQKGPQRAVAEKELNEIMQKWGISEKAAERSLTGIMQGKPEDLPERVAKVVPRAWYSAVSEKLMPGMKEAVPATEKVVRKAEDIPISYLPIERQWEKYVGIPAVRGIKAALGYVAPETVKKALVYGYGVPEKYLKSKEMRGINIGRGIDKAKEVGEALRKGTEAEQKRYAQIIKGSITKKPEFKAITDPAIEELSNLGARAVDLGLMNEETYVENVRKYMPRLYKKFEKRGWKPPENVVANARDFLSKGLVKKDGSPVKNQAAKIEKIIDGIIKGKPVSGDLYLQREGLKPLRMDLSRFMKRKDIPQPIRALMGEIEKAGYPVSKGIMQLTHDVETAQLFRFVATSPEWALDKEKVGFVKMPDTAKLGDLKNKYVLKSVADDINAIINIPSDTEKFLRRSVSAWKVGKAVLNPATQARNIRSNMILADTIGGLPPTRVDVYAKAFSEYLKKTDDYNQARDLGLLSGSWYKAEVKELFDMFEKEPGTAFEKVFQNVVVMPAEKAGKLYQGSEEVFKLAVFKYQKSKGLMPEEAAAIAEKAIFNYGKIPDFVDSVRSKWWGSPFFTFTYKAIPELAEAMVKRPLSVYKYILGAIAIEEAARKTLNLTADELREIKKNQPKWMRNGQFILLPWKDKYGQYQFYDLTFELPWGDLRESSMSVLGLPRVLTPGNPLFTIPAVLISGRDLFTGKDLVDETDTALEKFQKVSDYCYKQLMPSLAPEIPGLTKGGYSYQKIKSAILQRPDYFGRVQNIGSAAAGSILGMKASPFELEKEKEFRVFEEEEQIRELRGKIRSNLGSQALSTEHKESQIDKLRNKLVGLDKEQLLKGYYAPRTRIVESDGEKTIFKEPFFKNKGYVDYLSSKPGGENITKIEKIYRTIISENEVRGNKRTAMRATHRELMSTVLENQIIGNRKDKAVDGWKQFQRIWKIRNRVLEDNEISPGGEDGKKIQKQVDKMLLQIMDNNSDFAREYGHYPTQIWQE